MRRSKYVRIGAVIMCIVIIGTLWAESRNVYAALENEKDNKVRSVQVSEEGIESGTLIIGSHLIHINGLTDELYSVAQESANEFNQNNIYYKSELAGGSWFEISTATSIADITTQGNPVSKAFISEELRFTHLTNSKGITKDLRTGETVSIYDIPEPYDLEVMEELEPLKLQYQILQEKKKKNESDKIYVSMLSSFFSKDITNGQTSEGDKAVDGLNLYKSGLSGRGKPATWSEIVDSVMEYEDAKRRIEALTILSDNVDVLLNKASGIEDGEAEDGYELSDNFDVNSDIVAAIGDASQNIETSILEYSAKLIEEGETTTSKSHYKYTNDLINSAKASDTTGCDTATEKLANIDNILEGKVVDTESELNILKTELINEAYSNYSMKLSEGVSSDYQQAVSEGASLSVKNGYLKLQKDATNAARLEYQSLLSEQFKRMTSTEAQSYILTLIDDVPNLESLVPNDEASAYQLETVAEHLAWLKNDLAELMQNDAEMTKLEALQNKKDELAKNRQEALDNNDLKEEKRLTAEMEAVQQDINDLQNTLVDILNSPNSSEADKAQALAGLGEGNAAEMINALAESIASDVRNYESALTDSSGAGQTDGTNPDNENSQGKANNAAMSQEMANKLTALSAIGKLEPAATKAALDNIKSAVNSTSSMDESVADKLLEEVSDIEQEADELLASDKLSQNELMDLIDTALGSKFDEASKDEQTATVKALLDYADETANKDAKTLAKAYISKLAAGGNPYIYKKYDKDTEEYVSLNSISNVLGYRYVFDDAHYTVTLNKNGKYFKFSLKSKEYEMTGKEKGTLEKTPGLMSALYISENDSHSIFGADAEYIEGSDYAILVTEKIDSRIAELINILKEGGA